MNASCSAELHISRRRSRLGALVRGVVLLACAGLVIAGCNSTGQPRAKLADGLRNPFGWMSPKSDEEAFRRAVKRDSFPTAAEAGM